MNKLFYKLKKFEKNLYYNNILKFRQIFVGDFIEIIIQEETLFNGLCIAKKNKECNSTLILRNVLFLQNIIEKLICVGSLDLKKNDLFLIKNKFKFLNLLKMRNKLYYYRKKLRSENIFK